MKFFKGKSNGQIAAFVIGLFLMVSGLLLLIFGLIGDYGPRNNPFTEANTSIASAVKFPLSLTWIGVIAILVGSLTFALSLNFMAKATEREAEKEVRRKQRLEDINQSKVVDVEDITSTAK